uniref:Uncharacterized protein n=1 Tax=mine drainage metagenome TaxID=410659 RepID=E6QRA5_9ZZZZ
MQLDVFSAFCETADHKGILFYYSGNLSQNVVAAMGDALKLRLEEWGAKGGMARKLFSGFIEMMQNAVQYSPGYPDPSGDKIGTIAISKHYDKHYIVCGNLIKKENIFRIQEKLESLKNMSLEEIKLAYRTQLKNEDHDKDALSKGAGLGFLTLARDASEPMEYMITDVLDHAELAVFFLKTTI